jgi:hypothetical protein
VRAVFGRAECASGVVRADMIYTALEKDAGVGHTAHTPHTPLTPHTYLTRE